MRITTEVIVFRCDHYDMDGNKGLSVIIQGDVVKDNNKYGRDITNAIVPDYNELHELTKINAEQYPAKFKADISLLSKKAKNNKEVATVALSNLQYICSLDLVDRKSVEKK